MAVRVFDFVVFLCCASSMSCCKNGWIQFENKCYFFSRQAESWTDAISFCRVFDSKLAEPLTAEESHFLIGHSQHVGGQFWIGISDVIVEDRWIYTTGQKPITVNHFQSGQPNGHTSQNCVALDSSYHGYWNDLNCLTNYPFICETDAE
ncbi:perlucin-like [Mytilus trossulus]|uniref:perlucin-like n=1 Tax=Mytilus trossulus TaxID=6551 RepID=UPI0030050C5D